MQPTTGPYTCGRAISAHRYSIASVDQLPHHLMPLWLYGRNDLLPVADIDRTSYIFILGANLIASKGSIWTIPDVRR